MSENEDVTPEDSAPEVVVDDEGTPIQPGRRVDRKRGDDQNTKEVTPADQATPEAIKASAEKQREAAVTGDAPDPKVTGWDSAKQVAQSPSANDANYLRSPGEVREAGDA